MFGTWASSYVIVPGSPTVLLLHSDVAGGSPEAVFTDSSDYAHTLSQYDGATNNVIHSMTAAKFGATSIEQPAGNLNYHASYVTIDDGLDDFAFGTGDFCIECWLKNEGASVPPGASVYLFGSTNLSQLGFVFHGSNFVEYRYPTGSPMLPILTSVYDITTDTNWHHYCLERDAGIVTIYVDGVASGSPVADNSNIATPTTNPRTAGFWAWYGVRYQDELRVSNIAIYQGDFIPPTSPHTS